MRPCRDAIPLRDTPTGRTGPHCPARMHPPAHGEPHPRTAHHTETRPAAFLPVPICRVCSTFAQSQTSICVLCSTRPEPSAPKSHISRQFGSLFALCTAPDIMHRTQIDLRTSRKVLHTLQMHPARAQFQPAYPALTHQWVTPAGPNSRPAPHPNQPAANPVRPHRRPTPVIAPAITRRLATHATRPPPQSGIPPGFSGRARRPAAPCRTHCRAMCAWNSATRLPVWAHSDSSRCSARARPHCATRAN